jgi:hypothetical protein
MTTLTKADVTRAVSAVRDLAEIIERIEKATWPDGAGDVLRKSDLSDARPRASRSDDVATKALDMLAGLER